MLQVALNAGFLATRRYPLDRTKWFKSTSVIRAFVHSPAVLRRKTARCPLVPMGRADCDSHISGWGKVRTTHASINGSNTLARQRRALRHSRQFGVNDVGVYGTKDKTVPIDAAGRAAAKAIPQATLVEYDGAPHGLFATEKARVTQELLDFLGR